MQRISKLLPDGCVRTSMPTEQVSLQSNYFKTVDLSGRVSYTGGDINVAGYQELLTGRESRTNLRDRTMSLARLSDAMYPRLWTSEQPGT